MVGLGRDGDNIKTNLNGKIRVMAQDHVNLKSRGFLDPLSQACDEERVADTCNRQLSGTNGGLASCRCLYSKYICADYCKPKSLIL